MNATMTLKQASVKQWVKQAEKELPCDPQSLRVINQQLWSCCGDAGIVVFDSELQQQRTIPAADIGYLRDVAEMSNGDVVIASGPGLYHCKDSECSLCHATNRSNKIHTAYSWTKPRSHCLDILWLQEISQAEKTTLLQASSQASSFIRIKSTQRTKVRTRHKCFNTTTHRHQDG